MDLTTLAAIGVAYWIVAVTPGPANIANAAVAMGHGRRASLIFGTGLSVALCIWGLLAATGMGAVLQASAGVLTVMKILGGLYLLWLAWQSGRAALNGGITLPSKLTGSGRWFWRGFVLNMSNPKSVVAWMAALAVGLDPSDPPQAVVAATVLCMGLSFFNNYAYTMVFSLSGMMAVYARARRWIDGTAAAFFGLAGLGLLRSAATR